MATKKYTSKKKWRNNERKKKEREFKIIKFPNKHTKERRIKKIKEKKEKKIKEKKNKRKKKKIRYT